MILAATLIAAALADGPPPVDVLHPDIALGRDYAPILWMADDEPLHPMIPHPFAFDGADNDCSGGQDLQDAHEILFEDGAARACSGAGGAVQAQGASAMQSMMAYVERARRRELQPPLAAPWQRGINLPPPAVVYYGPAAHGEAAFTLKPTAASREALAAGALPPQVADALRAHRLQAAPAPGGGALYQRIGDPAREWYLGDAADGRDVILQDGADGKWRVYVGPSCRFEFWFYYLYDQGVNGHQHDSEHAFVFVQPQVRQGTHDLCQADAAALADGGSITPPLVRAVVGAGHEAHTANNILVASPLGPLASDADLVRPRRNAVFPLALIPHMPILVELGKHASAPDRNFDGRFDLGTDANVFPESVWGTRDVQSGNVGRLKLGAFEGWFSFPRAASGIVLEEHWRSHPEYEAVFPVQMSQLKDLTLRTFRLVPLVDLRRLFELLSAAVGEEEKRAGVERFLDEHRRCFWGDEWPPSVSLSTAALQAMVAGWARRTDPKRDVWLHHDHEKPDDIFKRALFKKVGLGAVAKADAGVSAYGGTLQLAQFTLPRWLPLVGGSMLFNDTTLNLQVTNRDAGFIVNGFRGRYFGGYLGAHARWESDTGWLRASGGLALGVPALGPLRSVSAVLRVGLSAEPFRVGGGPVAPGAPRVAPVAAVVSFEIVAGLLHSRHPLDF